jgi:hypothetical protein
VSCLPLILVRPVSFMQHLPSVLYVTLDKYCNVYMVSSDHINIFVHKEFIPHKDSLSRAIPHKEGAIIDKKITFFLNILFNLQLLYVS